MQSTSSDGAGTSQQRPQQPAKKEMTLTFLNGRKIGIKYYYDRKKAPKDRVSLRANGVDEVLLGGMKIPIGEPFNYEFVFEEENIGSKKISRHDFCDEHIVWWFAEYLNPAIAFREGKRDYYEMIKATCCQETVALANRAPELLYSPEMLLHIVKRRVCSRLRCRAYSSGSI